MTIPGDKFQLYQRLQDGQAIKQKKYEADSKETLGRWRGGSGGCITDDGKLIGNDPRKVVLRYNDIQTVVSFDKQLMFQHGFSNEDNWLEWLHAADVVTRCEEEIPMTREFDVNGITHKITGRPDTIVGSYPEGLPKTVENFKPALGIEYKAVCSFHTAMKVANFIDNKPKSDNVVQSAIYADHFNIPWVLAYTSRVNFPVSYGWPSKSNPDGRFTEHRALKCDDNGREFTLQPFVSLYDLEFIGDVFHLDGEPTAITRQGIERYYTYLAECQDNKTVPELRPLYDHWGKKIPAAKNDALRYDDFVSGYSEDWDEWIEACTLIAECYEGD